MVVVLGHKVLGGVGILWYCKSKLKLTAGRMSIAPFHPDKEFKSNATWMRNSVLHALCLKYQWDCPEPVGSTDLELRRELLPGNTNLKGRDVTVLHEWVDRHRRAGIEWKEKGSRCGSQEHCTSGQAKQEGQWGRGGEGMKHRKMPLKSEVFLNKVTEMSRKK